MWRPPQVFCGRLKPKRWQKIKQTKGVIRIWAQNSEYVCGWRKERALHFKGSVWDESLEIHKHKESDGGQILKKGGGGESAGYSLRESVYKCLAPKPTRSRLFIQSYPASWTITAQFTPLLSHVLPPSSRTPDVATGCQRIYTSHARPAPWHLSADRCTYARTL